MALQTHLFRRGASDVWRKRIPVNAGGGMRQISLRRNDRLIAKRRALIVGSENYGLFDAMAHKGPHARKHDGFWLLLSTANTRKSVRAVHSS